MSRTLGGTLGTTVAATATKPGYLIEIVLSTTYRYSTRGLINWDIYSFSPGDVRVSGMAVDASQPTSSASLLIAAAMSWASIARSETIPGAEVRVWQFYGDTDPDVDEVVLLFDGVGDSVSINDAGSVTITLTQAGGATLYLPRTYMTPAAGFNHLPKDGQLVTFNSETVRLTPDGV